MAQSVTKHTKGVTPLPSLIRASAWDAANMQMRKAGRSKWSRSDYNLACRTQERLVRACYGRSTDAADSPNCFIRFQIAESFEHAGVFRLGSDLARVYVGIEQVLNGEPITTSD